MTQALVERSNGQAMVTDRRPTAVLAHQLGIDRETMIGTLMATIMPNATQEEVAAFCIVSSKYALNPFTKEIYAYPKRGGGIQPVVGIDGWVTLVNRQEDLDGLEFDEQVDTAGKPISTTCRIYIKGRSRPVTITEWYDECVRSTEPWKQMPRRMLRHKALIQCARVAFGLSGITDEDEAKDIAPTVAAGTSTTETIRQLAAKTLPDTQLPEAEAEKKIQEATAHARGLEAARQQGVAAAQAQTEQTKPAPESQESPSDHDDAIKEDFDRWYAGVMEGVGDDKKYASVVERGVKRVALGKKCQNEMWKLTKDDRAGIEQSIRDRAGYFAG